MLMVLCTLLILITIIPIQQEIHLILTKYYSEHNIYCYLCVIVSELTPYGEGFYLTAVWCAMTLKWGFFLFSYSRKYRNFYVAERRKLLDPSTYDQV